MKKLLLLVALIWSCAAAAQPSGVCGEEAGSGRVDYVSLRHKAPQKDAEKAVFVAETNGYGELKDVLGEKIYAIDSLAVVGPIDESDFTTIWDSAFNGHLSGLNLEKADIKDKKIPDYALYDPPKQYYELGYRHYLGINHITLPDDVEVFGRWCFASMDLRTINFPKALKRFEDGAFFCDHWLSTDPMVIPEGITEIPLQCFMHCQSFSKLVLPSTLTKIGSSAFCNTRFNEFNLPEGLQSIGELAFQSSDVVNVDIPSSCTKIYMGAFDLCYYITSLSLPPTIEYLPNMFATDNAIEELDIPASVKVIDKSAFEHSYKLTKLHLHEGLQRVNSEAFASAYMLDSIYVPTTVEYLGFKSFGTFASPVKVYSPSPVPAVCENYKDNPIFNDKNANNAKVTVYVPVGAGDVYRNAFGWNKYTIVESAEMGDAGIVDTAGDGQAKVSATASGIVMHTASAMPYGVYTAAGAQVAVGTVDGEAAVAAAPGIYILKVGATATKIQVR